MKTGFLYPAGINETHEGNRMIRVYPDPAKNKIVIETGQADDQGTLSIINIHGQEIMTQKPEGLKTEIQIRDLPRGIYFVKLYSDKGISTLKFVKE
jgi:hypothetical protein